MVSRLDGLAVVGVSGARGAVINVVAVWQIHHLLVAVEVVVDNLVGRVIVREGALFAVVVVIFAVVFLNHGRLSLFLFTLVVVLAVAVLTTRFLVVVNFTEGRRRRSVPLVVERLL